MDEKLSLLKKYNQLGFKPMQIDGKAAFIKHWQTEPPEFSNVVRSVSQNSKYNIGLICGEVSNTIAIDVDEPDLVDYDPQPAIDKGALAHTTSSGIRLVFKSRDSKVLNLSKKVVKKPAQLTEEEKSKVSEKGQKLLDEGKAIAVIELLGNGRQFMAPPSIHPDKGIKLEWVTELNDNILEIKDLKHFKRMLNDCIGNKEILLDLFYEGEKKLKRRPVKKKYAKAIEEIKSSVDIGAVAERYTTKERELSGGYWQGKCPLHGDNHPSFTVWPGEGFFKCFGCDASGDVISLIQEAEGLNFKEAVKWLIQEYDIELPEQGPKKEKKGDEQGDETDKRWKPYFELNDELYLEVFTTDKKYKFAHLRDGEVVLLNKVVVEDYEILPRELPKIDGEYREIVKMPNENISSCSLLSPAELFSKIEGHIKHYCDMPDLDAKLCTFYSLFTWFYLKTNTLGYLRFLADTGKGKSRMLDVVGDLCFYPIESSGASTFSGVLRTNERWHGTLKLDESDFKGDKESQITKYLNLGFQKGKVFIMSDKQNPKNQELFDPFSPKVIAMREPFKDNATEGRLYSITPYETSNQDIPIILTREYYEAAQGLRNEIARFVLEHWQDIEGEQMIDFKDLGIEPRLRQLLMPLSIIFQLWVDGEEIFKDYMLQRQRELKKIRAYSWHGSMFNYVYGVAIGDETLEEKFDPYYIPDTKEIQAITPTMVAKAFGTNTKTVTQTLNSIGFDVERKWITYYKKKEGESDLDGRPVYREQRKRVRRYVVHDEKTWQEICRRYYYSEEDEVDSIPNPPEVLQSRTFNFNADQGDGTHGTDGTGHYTHSQKDVAEVGTDGTLGTGAYTHAPKNLDDDGDVDDNLSNDDELSGYELEDDVGETWDLNNILGKEDQ